MNNRSGIYMQWLLVVLCMYLSIATTYAQTDERTQARMYFDTKAYDKAIDGYKKLYRQQPSEVYDDYLAALLAAKEYKDAEKLVDSRLRAEPVNAMLYIDMGKVYLASGKEKKAEEQFTNSLNFINGDDLLTQRMANAFVALGKDSYAIQVYEHASQLIGNGYIYAGLLAQLYAGQGNMDKAIDVLLNNGPQQFGNADNTKATLLELLGTDAKKQQAAQKAILKKINSQPDNPYYVELLTWLYTQKDDWEGALVQMEALDARNREDGRRLINFARMALGEQKYAIALKAYNEVIDKGKDNPLYATASAEKIMTAFMQLKNNPDFKPETVAALAKQYDIFLLEYPTYYTTQTVIDFATLQAQYNNNPQKGIELLQEALSRPDISRNFIGTCKLLLGDYYILAGRIWDASLMYSQVDKLFKEDAMGEDARYRNGKLAYYRGDFEWAQLQLSVLKASTTELIANDALYLSVLITENIPPDSNYIPLRRYAYADLLLFQNKDAEAEALLDSIATNFPKHPLNDDIIMLRGRMAAKHRDYTKALAFYQQVFKQYGDDVLGDDALYNIAELYRNNLHQPEQAKQYYEQLITTYAGSTYVQSARKHLSELNNPVMP